MNTEEVLRFMHRILSCAPDNRQAQEMLDQLLRIVRHLAEKDPGLKDMPDTILMMMGAVNEGRDAVRDKPYLTQEDLRIVKQRYRERLERERQMTRC